MELLKQKGTAATGFISNGSGPFAGLSVPMKNSPG